MVGTADAQDPGEDCAKEGKVASDVRCTSSTGGSMAETTGTQSGSTPDNPHAAVSIAVVAAMFGLLAAIKSAEPELASVTADNIRGLTAGKFSSDHPEAARMIGVMLRILGDADGN